MNYELKTEEILLGSEKLNVTSLADLNRTIDAVFEQLEKSGNANLLEELCPYFGCVWPSAKALCNTLQFTTIGPRLKGASILEVGCGLALPSMIASRLGAAVTATDFHPEVPHFLNINLKANRVENVEYRALDWRNEHETLGKYDWIIGSDVLYESQHSLILARSIAFHLKEEGRAIIADPARPYLQSFIDEMQLLGFHAQTTIQTIPDSPQPKEIFVVEFRKK